MNNKNLQLAYFLPVLFAFFIMGFVDVVGIATNYVKKDFELNDTVANLLPMMVFLWFFVFSVPTGMYMKRIGRRKTVILSGIITFVALLLPLLKYNFSMVLVAFALLGIGNTILQVSLNPLLTNVVNKEKLTSSITLGQFIKAIASFLGPVVAAWAAGSLGNWKFIFPMFAATTLVSTLWLLLTNIKEESPAGESSSFIDSLSLLGDKTILIFFLGILFVVGVDVGLNTTIPKFLQERCGMPLEKAGFGTSLYFAARTAGTFLGAIILARMPGRKFFIINIIVAIAAMVLLMTMNDLWGIRTLIVIIGFTVANVFSIIFSAAIQHKPIHTNEISGLMVMGVSGGALITFLVGIMSDVLKGQAGGLLVLLLCLIYLFFCALHIKPAKA
ncbi:MAG: MFS transporter [Bacteroidales bacterium]|nr:MFS transporter [Bacteroidales bacterium]